MNFTDVVDRILPAAYQHASGNGHYSASKRQLYYACREEFKRLAGRTLDSQYFSNTLLVQYLNRNRSKTASWRITADPRGTLTLPNSAHEVRVPCGTIQIEKHLQTAQFHTDPLDIDATLDIEWPSLAAGQRYQGVLYIEKEGFEPVLAEARIAERFDLAILSCKGQSVVAARRFVDETCAVGSGVPLFVVHDLDKAGFEISQRLTQVSDWAEEYDRVAYQFENEINVTDLGLRLVDARKYTLAEEKVKFSGCFARDSICTDDEKIFLRSGRRVELNAFTSPQFVEWLEAKLTEHLPKRLLPTDEVLSDAYRRAVAIAEINSELTEVVERAIARAESVPIPKTLRRQLNAEIKRASLPWDKALYDLVDRKREDDE